MKGEFHRLRVLKARAETKDATSLSFHVPPPLEKTFSWRPGQHLTVRFRIDGVERRRPYSISESPFGGGRLRVTVKRIRGGLVSNHINRNVVSGDVVDVMPPFGEFYLDPDVRRRRTLYFFGAGSGITPLYSMVRSVLVAEPHSVARLLYGNSDADTIIFADDLSRLEKDHEDRLTVRHVLSSPSRRSSFRYWRRGRITAGAVSGFIDTHPPYAQDARYYVCGAGEHERGGADGAAGDRRAGGTHLHRELRTGRASRRLGLRSCGGDEVCGSAGEALSVPCRFGSDDPERGPRRRRLAAVLL